MMLDQLVSGSMNSKFRSNKLHQNVVRAGVPNSWATCKLSENVPVMSPMIASKAIANAQSMLFVLQRKLFTVDHTPDILVIVSLASTETVSHVLKRSMSVLWDLIDVILMLSAPISLPVTNALVAKALLVMATNVK